MQKISNNVYAETKFRGCNPGFVVTNEGVVMIDTPWFPSDAVRWRDEVNKYGKVIYIINTEPHPDHFTSNCFFTGTVVAHEGTRDAILAASVEELKQSLKETDPDSLLLMDQFEYRPPTITLSQQLNLYMGEHTISIINLPGHTASQVAVHIPEERVVFTGDNVFCRVQAWLHQCLPYQWLESLKRIEELHTQAIVPGHGEICDSSYIPEMSAFIQEWMDTITAAINRDISLEEAQDTISFLDRYPMGPGVEHRAHEIQRMNVARLYEVLKK